MSTLDKPTSANSRALSEARQTSDTADPSVAQSLEAAGVHRSRATLPAVSMRSVLALSLPAIAEQLVQAAIGLTDALVAGHMRGDAKVVAAAAAAVGMMAYVQWIAGLLNSAFGVGATAIIARSIGAGRLRLANRVAGTAVASALVLSAGLALFLFLFAQWVSHATGLHGLAQEFGAQYLKIMSLTIALQAVGQIGLACLRGAGDTFRPMLIMLGVAGVNIFTCICFTFGYLGAPEMGIRGIATGTMLAFLVGGGATTVLLLGLLGRSRLKLELRHLRIVPHLFLRLVRIGLPSWFEGVFLWAGQILIVVLVINANDQAVGIDGATLAAHNTVIRVESLAFLPGYGFGIACSTLVGQYLGARRHAEARRAANLCNRLAVGTMAAAALPMVLCPHLLLGLMISSKPVVSLGLWPMVLAGLAQPGFAYAITRSAALKGAGETVWPMVATLGGIFGIRVPVVLLALWIFGRMQHPEWGLIAVWIGVAADLSFRGLINSITFARGRWMRKRV